MAVEGDASRGPATRSSIQVIDRAVAMLRAIAEAGGNGLALKDVTTAAGLRPSTGRTLLSALATHGLVRQAGAGKAYLLGPTFFELNRSYVAQADLASVAAPVLQDLWQSTQETVHLSVLKNGHRVDLSVLVGPQLLNVNPTTAHFDDPFATPPFGTAAGKVLFAGLSPAERSRLLAAAPWRDAVSGTDKEIFAHAETVAAQGYATNYEEDAPGVCGVAAPVRDHTGTTVAALCIGYPAARHSPTHDESLRASVVAAAEHLSALLGDPE